jgi:hypothetical protein
MASLRAMATRAFVSALRFAICTPQTLSVVHCVERVNMSCAAV